MPMGNKMGPEGMGPGTGRGAGYCNGYDMPGACNRAGRGFGSGRMGGHARRGGFRSGFAGQGGFGGFRAGGYGNFNNRPVNTEEMLKEEADFLEKRLNDIRNQLNDLGKDPE